MVVATMQPTGFVGEMDRDAVLTHYERLLDSGLEQDEAISQTLDSIVHSGRAKDFVLAFGGTMVKSMLTVRQGALHPANYTAPRWKPEPVAPSPERDDRNGQAFLDALASPAAPSSPELPCADDLKMSDIQLTSVIPQGFPEPGAGRVLNMATLRKPRVLDGVLSGCWVVDRESVPMGLLTSEQCFKLAASEKRAGNTRLSNARMFRRLGESLKPGEVVADRWTDAKVNTLFELSEVSA